MKFEDLKVGMWLTQTRGWHYTFKPHTTQIVEANEDWVATTDYNGHSGGDEEFTMSNYKLATRKEIEAALVEFNNRGLDILPTIYPDRVITNSDYLEAQSIVCHSWRSKLRDWYANELIENGHAVVSDKQYKEMVKAANDDQLELIEEVLGLEIEEEVTYAIGQRFKVNGRSEEHILAQVAPRTCALIDLLSGNRYSEPFEVGHIRKITHDELLVMSSGYSVERVQK